MCQLEKMLHRREPIFHPKFLPTCEGCAPGNRTSPVSERLAKVVYSADARTLILWGADVSYPAHLGLNSDMALCRKRAMCGRLQVGKENLHVAGLVGPLKGTRSAPPA